MEPQTKVAAKTDAALLKRLGFHYVATQVTKLEERKRKLMIAHEHYRFVTQEKIDAFNVKLKKETGKNMNDPWKMEYKVLSFTSVSDYQSIPPADVLAEMEVAQERKCFDQFEVAYIKQVKDPIIFGRIEGCAKRFYVAQWDNDVRIEDLLMPNEG